MKKTILTGLVIFSFVVSVQSHEPESNGVDVKTQLENLNMKYQNALLENTNEEKKLVHRHDSICSVILSNLAVNNDIESSGKLSKKEQKSLEERLEMEYQTIDMIKQLSIISRGEIRKQYEIELKDFFEKYDMVLSSNK